MIVKEFQYDDQLSNIDVVQYHKKKWYELSRYIFILFINIDRMGVERKNPKLSVLGSFFMVVMAGTVYRLSKLNRKLLSSQLKDVI